MLMTKKKFSGCPLTEFSGFVHDQPAYLISTTVFGSLESLFVLMFYAPFNKFGHFGPFPLSCWVELVLNKRIKCLAQKHITVPPMGVQW